MSFEFFALSGAAIVTILFVFLVYRTVASPVEKGDTRRIDLR
jgi:hypothetical protein